MNPRRILVLFLSLTSCVYHDIRPAKEPVYVCDPQEITWQTDILPIMKQYCANPGCHDGVTRLDWTDYEQVKNYATTIRSKTQDRSMPFDDPMPQVEIDKIACWVDAGALDN